MNKIISLPKLTELLADATGLDKHDSEKFLLDFTALIADALSTDDYVKIKGLGQFTKTYSGDKLKITFVPDREMAQAINAPFAFFEPADLADTVTDEVLAQAATMQVAKADESATEAVSLTSVTDIPQSVEPDPIEPAPVPQQHQALPEHDEPKTLAEPQQQPIVAAVTLPPVYVADEYTALHSPSVTEPIVSDDTETTQTQTHDAPDTQTADTPEPENEDTPVTEGAQVAVTEDDPETVTVEPGMTEAVASVYGTEATETSYYTQEGEQQVVYHTEKTVSWFWIIISGLLGILIGFAIGHFTYEEVSEWMSPTTKVEAATVVDDSPSSATDIQPTVDCIKIQ